MRTAWRTALHHYLEEHYIQKPDEWYETILSPVGSLDVSIVSRQFSDLSSDKRRDQITDVLHTFSASVSPGFLTLDTPEEAEEMQAMRPKTLKSASSLNAARDWGNLAFYTADALAPSKPRDPRVPKTVAFYSFKGGVGRTTALAHVATLLAKRGRRVLAIDLDVASIGLNAVFDVTPPPHGLVDYLFQRFTRTEEMEPTILVPHLICEVPLEEASGQLFVVPPGDPTTLDYVAGANDLDADDDFRHGYDLWNIFYQEITDYLHPDLILVDAHAGIEKWAAFALLHAADQVLLFLYPDKQNLQGTRLIIQTLGDLLPTHFVFSRVPTTNERRMEILQQQWTILQADKAESTFMSSNGHSAETPLIIPSLPAMALAETYPVEELLPYYEDLANLIDEAADQERGPQTDA